MANAETSISYIRSENVFRLQKSLLQLLNQTIYIASNTMEISSSSSEKFEKEHTGKNEYLKNELKSLGVEPKRKNQLNDKEELEDLADNIKQAMFQDYKVAYSEKGDAHKEEAQSTVTVG